MVLMSKFVLGSIRMVRGTSSGDELDVYIIYIYIYWTHHTLHPSAVYHH